MKPFLLWTHFDVSFIQYTLIVVTNISMHENERAVLQNLPYWKNVITVFNMVPSLKQNIHLSMDTTLLSGLLDVLNQGWFYFNRGIF